MNLAPIVPEDNPDIPLKRNPSGFVTSPRIKTVAYLARAILHDVTVCAYCWKTGDMLHAPDGSTWGLDHVIPLCKGGIENLSNIVKCCQTCNVLKGRRIVAPHPGTSWAAPSPALGTMFWQLSAEIYAGISDGSSYVRPFTVNITEEELAELTAQWRQTQLA